MVFHLTAGVVSQKKIILFSAIMAKYMVQKIFILHSQTPVTVLFAEIELNLGEPLCSKQAKIFFLTKKLPLTSYRKSSFYLNGSSGIPLIMQTAIGQGKHPLYPYAYGTDHKCHCQRWSTDEALSDRQSHKCRW